MKKLLSALLLIFVTTSAFSQETKPESTWALKMNMPQLVDIFTFPAVNIGVEKNINNYLSLGTEIGYQFYDFKSLSDTIFLKPRGFKASVEGRIYILRMLRLNSQRTAKGLFCGLQAFYRRNQYTSSISYHNETVVENEEIINYSDAFGVKKKAYGLNLVLGFQKSVGAHFLFEPSLSLGYQRRDITNTNQSYNYTTQEIDGSDMVPFFRYLDTEEASGGAFNISFGFRLGYRL
jgi:hypothetical protein